MLNSKLALESRTAVQQAVNQHLMERLLSTPRGRAHVLNMLADAESSDEAVVFDLLLTRVGDERLHKMIRIHRDDEVRHAEMFSGCVKRQGFERTPVPDELKLILRMGKELGNPFQRGIESDDDVMRAYLLLQVIEERAITQFHFMTSIMRKFDPESADVMAEIATDEERHLKYCHAISREYASDERVLRTTLRRYRQIEAKCFSENGMANLRIILAKGLIPEQRPWEWLLFRALVHLPLRRPTVIATGYGAEPAAA